MRAISFCNLVPKADGSFEGLLLELSRVFQQKGDSLLLVFGDEPDAVFASRLRNEGGQYSVLSGWSLPDGGDSPWRLFQGGKSILLSYRPDVAVVNFGDELPCAILACWSRWVGLSTQWIWQQHQQINAPCGVKDRISRLRLLSWCRVRFVVLYEQGRESLIARGIARDRITLIPNSVSDHVSSAGATQLRASMGIPETATVFVTVSSLIARKRVSMQLAVLARLHKDGLTPHLVVLGDGVMRAELEAEAASLGLSRCVFFLGRRNDVRDILPECDVYLHTASAEAAPYSILEALCAGLPVIATRSGALSEQVEDGQSGRLVDQDNLEGLVNACRQMVTDPDVRQRMSVMARQRWERSWNSTDTAVRYHELYRSLAC